MNFLISVNEFPISVISDYLHGMHAIGFAYMCREGKQGRDRPETRKVICTGQEDRGGLRT